MIGRGGTGDRNLEREDFVAGNRTQVTSPCNRSLAQANPEASTSVVTAFVVSFSVPYILDDIGANIGWVFGGIAFMATILVFFVLPETKVRQSIAGPVPI